MKIREIYVKSFGCLSDFKKEFHDGFNAVTENNGFGKTTLATFVKAMFYSLGYSRSSALEENELKRFRPWNSTEKFGGSVTFEHDGKLYRIERTFGATQKDETAFLVDFEKNKKTELKEAFLSLSEEETFKYFDIFRKTLTGTIGKNLINMEFPLDQETEGGTQNFLMKLRKSKLTDDTLTEAFYDRIIENYDYGENYYIILIHAVYDIPGKSSDGAEMFDASDEIYDHILCSICPVKLSKAGLHYNAETNNIEDRIRDWLVEMPDWGFLFPQFNDRSTDIHGLLYYTKNAENLRSTMMEEVFGCTTPLSAGTQRDSFNALVEETLGDDCAYDTVLEIHEKLNDLIESQKDEPEPVVLTKSEVKRLFEECGVEDEKLQNFDEQYELAAGEKSALVASNITNTRKFEIKTPDVVIHVAPDRAELVETRIIDGRKCLVIPMESEIELNGIRVSTLNSVEDTSAEPLPVNDITDIDNSNTEEEIPF